MMRLPPTSISISPHDMAQTLQQLELYQGLLKQGFKKGEVASYFREQRTASQFSRNLSLLPEPGPAPPTVDLRPKNPENPVSVSASLCNHEMNLSERSNAESVRAYSLSDSESEFFSDESHNTPDTRNNSTLPLEERDRVHGPHAPRQSSLLRFARAVSSESPPDLTRIPFSPRPNISYRPRSETYSYDQSAIDDEENHERLDSPSPIHERLEHLTLNDELLFDSTLIGPRAGTVSDLRPEADTFTPLQLGSMALIESNTLLDRKSDDEDPSLSFQSSPPGFQDMPDTNRLAAPQTPVAIRSQLNHRSQTTRQRHNLSHQYLDGSFTVYDDSLPATVQPQTPADLDRGSRFNPHNAAYTAPPGMIRSGFPLSTTRQTSGDQSPTARAILIRERRQREYIRSARIEGLRLERARNQVRTGVTANADEQNNVRTSEEMSNNFWRDDLNADAVGDENFDAETLAIESPGRMRVVSGNRRFAQDI